MPQTIKFVDSTLVMLYWCVYDNNTFFEIKELLKVGSISTNNKYQNKLVCSNNSYRILILIMSTFCFDLLLKV